VFYYYSVKYYPLSFKNSKCNVEGFFILSKGNWYFDNDYEGNNGAFYLIRLYSSYYDTNLLFKKLY
jgi:hypothetical protein